MRFMFDTMLKLNLQKPDHMVFVAEDGSGGSDLAADRQVEASDGELCGRCRRCFAPFARTPAMIGALTAIEKVRPASRTTTSRSSGPGRTSRARASGQASSVSSSTAATKRVSPRTSRASNPQNIPFYARHGFEVREEIACGKGAPVVTTMWQIEA